MPTTSQKLHSSTSETSPASDPNSRSPPPKLSSSLFFGTTTKVLNKLQYVQNSAARLLTNTRSREHITPVLHDLHWLPIKFRIHFKILITTYKALNNQAPPYISDLLHRHAPSRSLRMRLQVLLVSILQVAAVDSLKHVYGYLGESVILPSRASENISRIEWSILPNITWIATFRNNKLQYRFWRYMGRLSLNTSSGDLVIRNLTREDALEYTVDLTNSKRKDSQNKVKLTVRQHLEKPSIGTQLSVLKDGRCLIVLNCSSPDQDVGFSWLAQPQTSINASAYHRDSHNAVFWTLFGPNSDVDFTCTTSKNAENASNVMKATCYGETPELVQKESITGFVFLGIFIGVVIGILLCLFRPQIQRVFKNLKDKVLPAK
ncbi:SLAM family member 9 [Polymixia lowei]